MILSPRYDGPPILTIDGNGGDQLAPITRQHRRLTAMLNGFDHDAWATQSRCDQWTARDVAAHLASVNSYWTTSIQAGLTRQPTRMLTGFDPATTPPAIVETMTSLTNEEVLAQFVAASETLLDVLAGLDDSDWSTPAESPIGHVPIRLVVHHALWDSWIHERDIAIPLGIAVPCEPDEVKACLRYAAAISPVLGLSLDRPSTGRFGVDATNPTTRFLLDVDHAGVAVHSTESVHGIPTISGEAVALAEMLSLRKPTPTTVPQAWVDLLDGLRAAFNDE